MSYRYQCRGTFIRRMIKSSHNCRHLSSNHLIIMATLVSHIWLIEYIGITSSNDHGIWQFVHSFVFRRFVVNHLQEAPIIVLWQIEHVCLIFIIMLVIVDKLDYSTFQYFNVGLRRCLLLMGDTEKHDIFYLISVFIYFWRCRNKTFLSTDYWMIYIISFRFNFLISFIQIESEILLNEESWIEL